MEFRILGPLEAVDAGGELVPLGGGKRRALLADLLLNVNSTVPVARLIDGHRHDFALAVKLRHVFRQRRNQQRPVHHQTFHRLSPLTTHARVAG